jgi:hypothetical protein
MATPFEWIIDANEITPAKLSGLLAALTGLVNEVDEELSENGERTLDLRVTHLSYNSPIHVGLTAHPRPRRPDTTARVLAVCNSGMYLLSREGSRPMGFSDDALEFLREVGAFTGEDVSSVSMRVGNTPIVPVITKQTSRYIDNILPRGYSVGSIEGRLEGLNIHRSPQFTVYDAVSGRAVTCFFRPDDLERVTDAVGRKVVVSGRIRRDPEGNPRQVRPAETFTIADEPPTVAFSDPAGGVWDEIDDPKRYLEIIRGE